MKTAVKNAWSSTSMLGVSQMLEASLSKVTTLPYGTCVIKLTKCIALCLCNIKTQILYHQPNTTTFLYFHTATCFGNLRPSSVQHIIFLSNAKRKYKCIHHTVSPTLQPPASLQSVYTVLYCNNYGKVVRSHTVKP